MFLFHELVDERDGGSRSESFVRHSINLGPTTLVLNVVRVLDEVEAELEEALVLGIARREFDVSALGREHLVAG